MSDGLLPEADDVEIVGAPLCGVKFAAPLPLGVQIAEF